MPYDDIDHNCQKIMTSKNLFNNSILSLISIKHLATFIHEPHPILNNIKTIRILHIPFVATFIYAKNNQRMQYNQDNFDILHDRL